MPPLRTGLLSFGLVSIPVQLHTATQDQHIAFHLLHDKCGSRVQNRYYCPVCNAMVERDDRVRGYEFAYYVGAGEGGEKPYRLLADALAKSNRAAIAQLVTRGKEQLVLIRPYENGLIMHSLYYANEVRNFADIAKEEKVKPSDEEIALGAN